MFCGGDARAQNAGADGDQTGIVLGSREVVCLELPLDEFCLEAKKLYTPFMKLSSG